MINWKAVSENFEVGKFIDLGATKGVRTIVIFSRPPISWSSVAVDDIDLNHDPEFQHHYIQDASEQVIGSLFLVRNKLCKVTATTVSRVFDGQPVKYDVGLSQHNCGAFCFRAPDGSTLALATSSHVPQSSLIIADKNE